jgi:hypothetical protein
MKKGKGSQEEGTNPSTLSLFPYFLSRHYSIHNKVVAKKSNQKSRKCPTCNKSLFTQSTVKRCMAECDLARVYLIWTEVIQF